MATPEETFSDPENAMYTPFFGSLGVTAAMAFAGNFISCQIHCIRNSITIFAPVFYESIFSTKTDTV